MDPTGIAIAFAILLIVAVAWFGLHYWANPPLDSPDAEARVAGNCGDTMEIGLCFENGVVTKTRTWTDGCSVSRQCLDAAALLAKGKSLEELRRINMMDVMELTGELPDTHLHCAQLAETTLQHALKDYLKKQRPQSCHCNPGGSC